METPNQVISLNKKFTYCALHLNDPHASHHCISPQPVFTNSQRFNVSTKNLESTLEPNEIHDKRLIIQTRAKNFRPHRKLIQINANKRIPTAHCIFHIY